MVFNAAKIHLFLRIYNFRGKKIKKMCIMQGIHYASCPTQLRLMSDCGPTKSVKKSDMSRRCVGDESEGRGYEKGVPCQPGGGA
jgi:hypothetical protein